MSVQIDKLSVVDDKAQLGADVQIGPFCHIGPDVILGDRVKLHSHVVVAGHTSIGTETQVFPFASLGHEPQDLKYRGEPSKLIIGERNKIREHVTMNPGTADDRMETVVGDDGLYMMSSHVAHDCVVGNRVILANNATLAGHVVVGDYAIIGGLSGVHQFVRIGAHAMIGGMSAVEHDVIPYGIIKGERAHLAGLNYIGLERRGFDRKDIARLMKAYRQLFSSDGGTLSELTEEVAATYGDDEMVMDIVEFVRNRDSRPICRPRLN